MTRLDRTTLAGLPADIARPSFERAEVGVGVVHLGIGAFHRAHQAVYTDDVLNQTAGDWAICGVSLQSARVRDQMASQDGLYTVVERGAKGERLRVIGAVKEVVFAPENPGALLARMADPAVKVVTLTVTEKGYCHDPATGRLQADHPDIAHDLANLDRPRTAIGYLVASLAQRRKQGLAPFTVLSCDNIPENGKTVRAIALAFAERVDPGLAAWIAEAASFPCTMVDRIVPATTEDDLAMVEARLGHRDEAAVVGEPFRQWVIEDRFTCSRPAWDRAGAEMVADVAPFEEMKLRLLNGSHSTLAYLGYLAGFDTISETVRQPAFVRLIRRLMDEEVTPTLHVPPGTDLGIYKRALIERFANPALKHRTWQIAMDGSQKLPQRLLATIRDRLDAGGSVRHLALGVAAWMRYATGIDEAARPIDVRDPLAGRLRRIAEDARGAPATLANAMLHLQEVFGDDLPRAEPFRKAVTEALVSLYSKGARQTVEECSGT